MQVSQKENTDCLSFAEIQGHALDHAGWALPLSCILILQAKQTYIHIYVLILIIFVCNVIWQQSKAKQKNRNIYSPTVLSDAARLLWKQGCRTLSCALPWSSSPSLLRSSIRCLPSHSSIASSSWSLQQYSWEVSNNANHVSFRYSLRNPGVNNMAFF